MFAFTCSAKRLAGLGLLMPLLAACLLPATRAGAQGQGQEIAPVIRPWYFYQFRITNNETSPDWHPVWSLFSFFYTEDGFFLGGRLFIEESLWVRGGTPNIQVNESWGYEIDDVNYYS